MSNRLAVATSPYLRLHAENPVDWYPWGEEAFAAARDQQRPIFLSIGYFTCHWCHVMERESFSDPAVAEILNRSFVSIKVDREERPDVDRLYMAFVQASTGGGGWPLSAFLTPERKPFYGGTYFPPQDRHGLPSFRRLLATLAQAWSTQRAQVEASAGEIGGFLAKSLQAAGTEGAVRNGGADPGDDAAGLRRRVWPVLFSQLRDSYDPGRGGFGSAPKFPRPAAYGFLLRQGGKEARAMVMGTLRAMAAGGIHDQLGGGFHRYATDDGWLVPHFEKMLYDQAQLAVAYTEAWQASGGEDLAATARRICEFVLREMATPDGGFVSAQDADSPVPAEHRRAGGPDEGEGAYYLWTGEDFRAVLGPDAAALAARHYGIQETGNVPRHLDPQGEFTGKNILFAAALIAPADAEAMAAARGALYAARRQRPHPPTDTKVLASWNGLMITALARCGAALQEPEFVAAARRTAQRLLDRYWRPAERQLWHIGGIAGFAEDYAFWVQALLDLHQADGDAGWLVHAEALQQAQEERFADLDGAYFSAAADPALWLRMREDYDGAEPSPNSVSLSNLQRLAVVCDRPQWRERAEQLARAYAARMAHTPQALPAMIAGLGLAEPARTVRIHGANALEATQALALEVQRRFLPTTWLLWERSADGRVAAEYCHDNVCELPINDPGQLARLLSR